MLRIKTQDNEILLQPSLFSEDYSSDREFYNNKLLNFSSDNVINKTLNTESYEYKPKSTNEFNFNIFFLRYIQNTEYNQIINYLEKDFELYYKKSLSMVNSITENLYNDLLDLRQPNGMREPNTLQGRFVRKKEEILNRKKFVSDIVGELRSKRPENSGVPVFYNTFTLPFWDSKDIWINDGLLYSNKSFLFNSFLLAEFYDSPSNINQNRIKSIPIFVNNRYNITETPIIKNIHYERPSFKLTEGVDGYSLFFLDSYYINEFYVRFSFWDALNGRKISLLPSSENQIDKKWLQDSDSFDQKNRYLRYVFDYSDKTYSVFEYNNITKNYDIEKSDFDLYELKFDSYFKNNIVLNDQPINSKSLEKSKPRINNPLNFDIENINTNTILSNPLITNSDTFGILPKLNLKSPAIKRNIEGYNIILKSFNLTNIDNQQWDVRSIGFNDIKLIFDNKSNDDLTFSFSENSSSVTITAGVTTSDNIRRRILPTSNNSFDVLYNQIRTLWNESPKYIVSESLIIPKFIKKSARSSPTSNTPIQRIAMDINKPQIELGREIRNDMFSLFSVFEGDRFLYPNRKHNITLYFNIGENVKYLIENINNILITGLLRISIINKSNEIKNINIPIKSRIESKNKTIITLPSNDIPNYTTLPDPDSGRTTFTIVK